MKTNLPVPICYLVEPYLKGLVIENMKRVCISFLPIRLNSKLSKLRSIFLSLSRNSFEIYIFFFFL